jgi:hypothetical protein
VTSLFGVSCVGPDFVTATSALLVSATFDVDELFAGVRSPVAEETFAVFATVPVALLAVWTTSENVADAPGAKEALVQEIVAPVVQANSGPDVWFSEM